MSTQTSLIEKIINNACGEKVFVEKPAGFETIALCTAKGPNVRCAVVQLKGPTIECPGIGKSTEEGEKFRRNLD